MQRNIIGVRFTKIGKVYHFDSSALPDVKTGEHVIVDTTRGKHLGEVAMILQETPPMPEGGWKPSNGAPRRAICCSSNPGNPNKPKP